ncbi:MAG: hypothetical protein M1820_002536 [Bogoriella megaspora]|nr:MAG: hypothetical protein M1820_002536 [Bogoriella megaspora]
MPERSYLTARLAVSRSASDGSSTSGRHSPNLHRADVDTVDRLGVATAREHVRSTSSSQDLRAEATSQDTLILKAGLNLKPFKIHTKELTTASPFFASLICGPPIPPSQDSLNFPDLEERSMYLFTRWIYGGTLSGPTDFQSMQNYMGLYVLALRFDVAALQNEVVDRIRNYYRRENLTAPPYRLEYIYENTDQPCALREFFTETAAYRVLCEPTKGGLADATAGVVAEGGDLAVDFVNALAKMHWNDVEDVRRGNGCRFHVHEDGERCAPVAAEPWQTG